MNIRSRPKSSNMTIVLLGASLVIVLAGILVLQLTTRTGTASQGPAAPQAYVPPPTSIADMGGLEFPCWSCPEGQKWPLRFRTNLDILAPLGTGPANAAEWYVQFRKPDGERFAEAQAMMDRRVAGPPRLKKVLPPDDPLLLEAEPWSDQATMRFYPEVLPFEGVSTAFPNLLVPLTFARSWVARGLASEDIESALEDCRRAIRLGRLMRQDDLFVIADLIGLACIRAGAEGLHELAIRHNDMDLAWTASVVLGEVAPQRLLTSERVTRVELEPFASLDANGDLVVRPPDSLIANSEDMVRNDPDRRFRCESMTTLSVIRVFGSARQQQKVTAILDDLVKHPDEMTSLCATWAREGRDIEANRDGIKGWYHLGESGDG